MASNRNRLNSASNAFLVFGSAVCLASCFYFLFAVYPHHLHSDSASNLLLAEEMLRSGQWLPHLWHYVSDSIIVAGSAQLAAPFVAAWGVSPAALAWVASACLALLIGCAYFLARTAGLSGVWALCAAAAMVCGPSIIYSDLVLGLMVTLSLAQSAVLLAAVQRSLASGHRGWMGACAALLLLCFATNPRKAFVFQALPIFVALAACHAAMRAAPDAGRFRQRCVALAGTALASIVAGYGLHHWLASYLHVSDAYARYQPALAPGQVLDNLRTFMALALKFLGITEDGPRDWLGLAVSAHRAITAATILILFALGTAAALRRKERTLVFLAAYAVSAASLTAAALLTAETIKQYYGIYYLVFAGVPLLIVALHYANSLSADKRNALVALVLMPALLLSLRTHLVVNAHYPGPGINQRTDNAEKAELIAWLDQRGLRRGYSYFWEANAMTVLSEGRLRVVPVTIGQQGWTPFRWLISEREISATATRKPVFLALPGRAGKSAFLPECLRDADRFDVPPYRVFVFPHGAGSCLDDRRGIR